MKRSTSYGLILFFSTLGVLLSGYLSYKKLFAAAGCSEGFLSQFVNCGAKPVYILNVPSCVYGFFMFATVAVLALIGFSKLNNRGLLKAEMLLGVIGTLFAAGLSIYELWIIKVQFSVLPSCVYGFFLYLGVLIVSTFALRQKDKTPPMMPPATA